MTRVYTFRVCKGDGVAGSDAEHIVEVIVEEPGVETGRVRLAGGSRSTAIGIARSLKNLSDNGTDIMEFLPSPEPLEPEEA